MALLGTLPFSHTCVAPAGICTARLALNEIIGSLPDTSDSARAAATVIYERGPDSRAPHDRLAVGFCLRRNATPDAPNVGKPQVPHHERFAPLHISKDAQIVTKTVSWTIQHR